MSVLYTVVPPEDLWEDEGPGAGEPQLVVSAVNGVPVLARRTSGGEVLERVLTTNPYVFLDPAFAPGRALRD
ncbi:MAG: YlzJ-like family protein [Chitinophagales bacterium]